MREIKFERVEVEGFKCFTAPATLDVASRDAGLHYVRGDNKTNKNMGSNGAGKSTLVSDAPTWCLFGRTVSGLRTTDIRGWGAKRAHARVALHLTAGGAAHVIERTSRSADLSIDGNAVGQQDVVDLLGLDFAAWEQAVVWGQGRPLFFDMTPNAKMQVLSDALNLERWERRSTAAASRASQYEERAREAWARVAGLNEAVTAAQAAQADAKTAAAAWGQEHAARLAELADSCQKALRRRDEVLKRHGTLEMDVERLNLQRTDARTSHRIANDAAAAARRESDDAARDARSAAEAAKRLRDELARVEETGKCPTCGQAVRPKSISNHVAETRRRAAELEVEAEAAKKRQRVATKRAEPHEAQVAREEEALSELEQRLAAAESGLRLSSRTLGEADQALRALQREQEREGAAENPHRAAAATARSRLSALRAEISELEERAKKYEQTAARAKFWAQGFRGIRLSVMDEVLADLQESTAAVLTDLGMSDWEVSYLTERETKSGSTQRALTVSIRAPHSTDAVRWESWSGGEQQRLRLAGAAALSAMLQARAGVHVDFRVLDEPTRGMSAAGVPSLCESLADYAEADGLKIFYVDHMARDSRTFASTVTIARDKSGARVQENR